MVRLIRTSVCLLAAVFVAAAVHAQTADEIVAKNLKARGGAEKLKATNTVKITATISAQGMEMPMTIWAKRPNLMRRETSVQDKRIVMGFDGVTPWTINPTATGSDQPQELTGPMAQVTRDESDFDGVLVDYKEKGNTVELVGPETLDSRKAYHLKVTKKNGQIQHLFVDAESGVEARTVMSVAMGPGPAAEVTMDLSNYQVVDGLSVPFSMKQTVNGQVAEVKIEKVEFNLPIDESMFKMPGKK